MIPDEIDLVDLGELQIHGDVRGLQCPECQREFFVYVFDESPEAEEWPIMCPWCGPDLQPWREFEGGVSAWRPAMISPLWGRGDGWFTYVATDGRVLLKHRYRGSLVVLCPHCDKPLEVAEYRAQCCGQEFRVSFGDITRKQPIGASKEFPRGWKSVKPWKRDIPA